MPGPEKDTPLARDSSNATNPPKTGPHRRERQRVRKACEACRKKKIKCNGQDPCQRCKAFRLCCEYNVANGGQPVGSSVFNTLEHRVGSMETQFEKRLDMIEQLVRNLSDQVGKAPSTTDETASPDLRSMTTDFKIQRLFIPPPEPVSLEGAANRTSTLSPRPGVGGTSHQPESPPATEQAESSVQDSTEEEQLQNQDVLDLAESIHVASQQVPARSDDAASEKTAEIEGFHADEFGELVNGGNGMRYVGVGATAVILDGCEGLRKHINEGLRQRGCAGEIEFLSGPASDTSLGRLDLRGPWSSPQWELPSWDVVDALLKTYVEAVYPVFPIITGGELWVIYTNLVVSNVVDTGQASVLMAALATAAPLAPQDRQTLGKQNSSQKPLGLYFFTLSMELSYCRLDRGNYQRGGLEEAVVACGLLGMYLAESGNQAEAWVMVGKAIRLGQDIGLHRSPERLRLPVTQVNRRRIIWWCLYLLERQLSFALGRPLMIRDDDCDVELPDEDDGCSGSVEIQGLLTLAPLLSILGRIQETIYSVKNARKWGDSSNVGTIRNQVQSLDAAVESWASEKAPQFTQGALKKKDALQSQICLLIHNLAVMDLYKPFMAHPHRPSPLEQPYAQMRCAKAAIDCIQGSKHFLESVPEGHYHVLHGQSLLVCATALLHISRHSEEPEFFPKALFHTDLALQSLRQLESSWEGALRCRKIVEEYLQLTNLTHNGVLRKSCCNFVHASDFKNPEPCRGSNSLKRRSETNPGMACWEDCYSDRTKFRKLGDEKTLAGGQVQEGAQTGSSGCVMSKLKDSTIMGPDQMELDNSKYLKACVDSLLYDSNDVGALDFGFGCLFDQQLKSGMPEIDNLDIGLDFM